MQALRLRNIISTCSFVLPFLALPRSVGAFSRAHPAPISLNRKRLSASAMSAAASSSRITLTNPERVQHVDREYLPEGMRAERTKVLVDAPFPSASSVAPPTSVYYWMQRDVRTQDNWALCLACHVASHLKLPLRVVYAMTPPPTTATSTPPPLVDLPWTRRHADFSLGGLECVHQKLAKRNIPLHVVMAPSHASVGETTFTSLFSQPETAASLVVCDFSPLRQYREWLELQLAPHLRTANIPLWQVDAHNIVPVWTAAPSRQVGARTLRPKIHNVYKQYMKDFPPELRDQVATMSQASVKELPPFDRASYETFLKLDESVPSAPWATPGTKAAGVQLQKFMNKGLAKFDALRNDPTLPDICSNLSPWINHGHVSFQRVAHEVQKLNKHGNGTASFIEEGVIRRELSDNYLYYTPNHYDSLLGAADWAQESLREHMNDPREPAYTLKELENAMTYDDLWNAAQLQLTKEGQMHGFLRMYWAKKILEWTAEGPAVALSWAQYLNDKYALDGRDPNGFVGVGWSIMGIHDMGWKERPIFGKIRYMNYAGCKRKFKVDAFVARYKGAAENAFKAASKQSGPTGADQQPKKKQKTLDAFARKK